MHVHVTGLERSLYSGDIAPPSDLSKRTSSDTLRSTGPISLLLQGFCHSVMEVFL